MQETIDYIEGKVMPLVYKATFWKDRSINLYSNFRYDIGFDSLDFIGFIIEVEKEFGVHITDEEREDIKNSRRSYKLGF